MKRNCRRKRRSYTVVVKDGEIFRKEGVLWSIMLDVTEKR